MRGDYKKVAGQTDLAECEVRYSTIELEFIEEPLVLEEYLINGKPGRPFDLPTSVARRPSTNEVVLQEWRNPEGQLHRMAEPDEWKPAQVIESMELSLCRWYRNGIDYKFAFSKFATRHPNTGELMIVYEDELDVSVTALEDLGMTHG